MKRMSHVLSFTAQLLLSAAIFFLYCTTTSRADDEKKLTKAEQEEQGLLLGAIQKANLEVGEKVIVINLSSQELAVLEQKVKDEWPAMIFSSPCNTGRVSKTGGENLPTPTTINPDGSLGWTTVIEKNDLRHSSEFDSDMPYALVLGFKDADGQLRGICIHEGAVRVGYSSSHACVRLPKGMAKTAYDLAKVGTKVFVVGETATNLVGGFNPDDYIVWQNRKGKNWPVFKAALPDATDEDRNELFTLFEKHLLHIDYLGLNGGISRDKSYIRVRLETMPHGSGIKVNDFEKMYGVEIELRPPSLPK